MLGRQYKGKHLRYVRQAVHLWGRQCNSGQGYTYTHMQRGFDRHYKSADTIDLSESVAVITLPLSSFMNMWWDVYENAAGGDGMRRAAPGVQVNSR
jgi:hypothetical protein